VLLLFGMMVSMLYLCFRPTNFEEDSPALRRLREAHGPDRATASDLPAATGPHLVREESVTAGDPPRITTWPAKTRPVEGFRWAPVIVRNTLMGLWASDVQLGIAPYPGVDVAPDGIYVNSGWYRYMIPWQDIEYVSSPETTDRGNPRVLTIKRASGELLVLSDLALGAETQAVADAAQEMRREATRSPGANH
jgi:hypothetical protein